ncbi:UNVERIFIED_CONTAM: hypothetical protein GTU68_039136 [Idotea baltica]|nr:hypothetical protein [Idotea baltica]
MISEFKEFALKGNMVDMAVGIVMGGAVGTLVGSMVTNLINPIVGLFTGGQDFEDGTKVVEDLMLNYGSFISAFINFLILAFVIFMIVKMVNNAKNAMGLAEEEKPAGPTETELLTEIRDALKR